MSPGSLVSAHPIAPASFLPSTVPCGHVTVATAGGSQADPALADARPPREPQLAADGVLADLETEKMLKLEADLKHHVARGLQLKEQLAAAERTVHELRSMPIANGGFATTAAVDEVLAMGASSKAPARRSMNARHGTSGATPAQMTQRTPPGAM